MADAKGEPDGVIPDPYAFVRLYPECSVRHDAMNWLLLATYMRRRQPLDARSTGRPSSLRRATSGRV